MATIPVDVKICLLKSAPNKTTLVSLRLLCKSYEAAYRADETSILTNVMIRDLHDNGYKAKDVLKLLWKMENGQPTILYAPRHPIYAHYTRAIRSLYELESVGHPRRTVEKEHCLLLMDMHEGTNGDPELFLAGLLYRQIGNGFNFPLDD